MTTKQLKKTANQVTDNQTDVIEQANQAMLNTSFKNLGVQCFLSSAKKLKDDQSIIDAMSVDILQQLRVTNSLAEFKEYVSRMIKNVSNKKIELPISFKKVDLVALRDYLIKEHTSFLIIKESKLTNDVVLQYKLGNIDAYTELKIKLDKMTAASASNDLLTVPERFGFNTKNSLKVYSFVNTLNEYINTVK